MKRGRRKTTKPLKEEVFSLRATKEEAQELKEKINESGMSASIFLRKAAFDATIYKYELEVIKILRQTINELTRIGVNLNNNAKSLALVNNAEFKSKLECFLQNYDYSNRTESAKKLNYKTGNSAKNIIESSENYFIELVNVLPNLAQDVKELKKELSAISDSMNR